MGVALENGLTIHEEASEQYNKFKNVVLNYVQAIAKQNMNAFKCQWYVGLKLSTGTGSLEYLFSASNKYCISDSGRNVS